MITDKLSPIGRALVAAASMPAPEARRVLMLICAHGMKDKPQSEGEKAYAKREPSINRMQGEVERIFGYAKHETLRKIEKHFRQNPGVKAAAGDTDEEPKPSSLAARLTFKKRDFTDELLDALREEALGALGIGGQQLFDEIGRDDPWKMPGRDAKEFINQRENLLSKVPDEVHSEIMQSIQTGLDNGESRKQLMGRISSKWDEINKSRSQTIAHTETAAAFNYARDKAMREAGVTHKKWLHSQSPLIKKPRETHVENDGQVRPIDKPFNIGGVKFNYPTDDSLGAGPEDIINCHCVSLPVEK